MKRVPLRSRPEESPGEVGGKGKRREGDGADAGSLLPRMALGTRPAFSAGRAPGADQSNLFTVRALMVIFYDVV